MIVVDASALAAFILKEEGWEGLTEYLVYSIVFRPCDEGGSQCYMEGSASQESSE